MKNLVFTTNWNHKLATDNFTTIRLANAYFYQVGETYRIIEKRSRSTSVDHGIGKIIKLLVLKLDQLKEFMCYLDTGYSLEETKAIIQKMYPSKDWSAQDLYYMLIKKVKQ